jgi:hypothetical protein
MSSTPRRDRLPLRDDTETFSTTYSRGDDPPSEAVVRTVAAVVGRRPDRLYTRLFDVVDPDALDRLFSGTHSEPSEGTQASFVLADCLVTVHTGGRITVQFPIE